ncbi:glycosyltransferase [Polynucleobacter sp. CS-Odin-A6]|uniref:glycosyltransferase n=1 Tax=Polynucleobacter sp. CS-Odin-A6 TaxID=2689106 RepID=UPI001C0C646C|nr:glycosyltransferase [Polynucleobacter sp. CS-Odin-A6]MBU3621118.1 hypothetical protein [Polynucleobacter sp. CS-Odin-A6]
MNEKKLAIVTRASGIDDICKISHPLLREYAKKCKAEFIVISERKVNIGLFHNEIFQLYDLLKEYNRICLIDSDVIIKPDTPNIFEVVPNSKIASVFEDYGSRKKSRQKLINSIQNKYGDINWKSGYINTGFFVCSDLHRDIFKVDNKNLWSDIGHDDVQIGYNINKLGYKIHELEHSYNHMSLFSEQGKSWLDSYVIHYAGNGFYRRMLRIDQMKRDLDILDRHPIKRRRFINLLPRLRLVIIGKLMLFKSFFQH